LAGSLHSLGVLLDNTGKTSEAIAAFQRAIALRAPLIEQFPDVPAYRATQGKSHNSLGIVFENAAKWQAAEEAFQKALELKGKVAADFPHIIEYQVDLGNTHNSLGNLYYRLGQFRKAESAFQESERVWLPISRAHPDNWHLATHVGGAACNRGNALKALGQSDAALESYHEAARILDAALQRQPRFGIARQFLCNTLFGRAGLFVQLRRYTEAIADFDRAIELSDPSPEVRRYRSYRARALAAAGQHAKAVAEAEALAAEKDSLTGEMLYQLACAFALGSAAETSDAPHAEEYAVRAVDLLRQAAAKGEKSVNMIQTEAHLQSLQTRADFHKLAKEVEARDR
jgi:tetratricopeptide (TPR) repeat protein